MGSPLNNYSLLLLLLSIYLAIIPCGQWFHFHQDRILWRYASNPLCIATMNKIRWSLLFHCCWNQTYLRNRTHASKILDLSLAKWRQVENYISTHKFKTDLSPIFQKLRWDHTPLFQHVRFKKMALSPQNSYAKVLFFAIQKNKDFIICKILTKEEP